MRSDRYAKQVSDPLMHAEVLACIRATFPVNTRVFFAREIARTVRKYPGRYPALAAYEKDLTRWVSRWLLTQGWDTQEPRTNATRWIIPAGFVEATA
jgi:hypothetical protein